jgi:tetratricopeptide (TPR) repeat protein
MTVVLPDNSFGWKHWAYALHELKRTKEAWGVLIPVVDKFPDDYIISYNLACYCCQLGKRKEAFQWLWKAIDLAGKKDIRLMALDDPDLEPLWPDISEI